MLSQGEDVVRESGVPFAVVRPTALTEEDAGAELQFDQGDTIKVGTPVSTFIIHQQSLSFIHPVIYHLIQLSDPFTKEEALSQEVDAGTKLWIGSGDNIQVHCWFKLLHRMVEAQKCLRNV